MSDAVKIAAPRTVEQATALLERYATIEGDLALIEHERGAAIAGANVRADAQANPLLAEREAIRLKLEPWWRRMADKLTAGTRKSIELGGCVIGTRSGKASLAVEGDEKAIAAKLARFDWAQELVRRTVRLDKAAVLKATGGEHARQLARLGLSRKDAAELFVLERAEQGGTLTGERP